MATEARVRETGILFQDEMILEILADRKTQTRRVLDAETVAKLGLDHVAFAARIAPHVTPAPIAFPVGERPFGAIGDHLWCREAWALRAMLPNSHYLYGPLSKLGLRNRYTSVQEPLDRNHLGHGSGDAMVQYRADPLGLDEFRRRSSRGTWRTTSPERWRPSIFMPRWASRITLEIVEIRVQRLQDISEADCWAEGIRGVDGHFDNAAICAAAKRIGCSHEDARPTFSLLWDSINGRRRRREYLSAGDPGYTGDRPWRTVTDESARWDANPWVRAITFKRITP